jgi:hypothetical protein
MPCIGLFNEQEHLKHSTDGSVVGFFSLQEVLKMYELKKRKRFF